MVGESEIAEPVRLRLRPVMTLAAILVALMPVALRALLSVLTPDRSEHHETCHDSVAQTELGQPARVTPDVARAKQRAIGVHCQKRRRAQPSPEFQRPFDGGKPGKVAGLTIAHGAISDYCEVLSQSFPRNLMLRVDEYLSRLGSVAG
jgi:hypothetical protein